MHREYLIFIHNLLISSQLGGICVLVFLGFKIVTCSDSLLQLQAALQFLIVGIFVLVAQAFSQTVFVVPRSPFDVPSYGPAYTVIPYRNHDTEYRNPFSVQVSGRVQLPARAVTNTIENLRRARTIPLIPEFEVNIRAPDVSPQSALPVNPGAGDTDAKEGEEDACVVCLTRKRNHAVVPCGHLVLCGTCIGTGKIDSCPICRSSNIEFMRIYGE